MDTLGVINAIIAGGVTCQMSKHKSGEHDAGSLDTFDGYNENIMGKIARRMLKHGSGEQDALTA